MGSQHPAASASVTVQDLLRNYLSRVDVVFERFRKDQDMDLFLPIDTICVLERSRFHDGEARKGSLVRERRANQSVGQYVGHESRIFVLHVTLEKKSIVWLERQTGRTWVRERVGRCPPGLPQASSRRLPDDLVHQQSTSRLTGFATFCGASIL